MVKPDAKHNYYADLELPSIATVEEVKKQYRKLALLYHPDRNAGKEEEFVPKFQAIQTAHEVLGDATLKARYDAERQKAGLYPTFRPGQQTSTPGNPYKATSAYPPPPRRTQPNAWPRPASGGSAPSGADRFTNFRPAPTARKDAGASADRTNAFRAWQNMNAQQERQQYAPAPQPSPNRPRPPPRQDTRMPSEEEIRAGTNYRSAKAQPQSDAAGAEARQSAWASFQQKNAGMPGVSRSNTTRTPKRTGFDPNQPGSDERPVADRGYSHRHKSEDFGRPSPRNVPPPPPGPPPMSPSPTTSHRPGANPLRPTRSRPEESSDSVPYAEGTRVRTPYSSFIGEKTQFQRESPDGLRRSASHRDTSKLDPNGTPGRARSTSPLGRQKPPKDPSQNAGVKPSFVAYSSSEESVLGTSEEEESGPKVGAAPRVPNRPKATPTSRARRANGYVDPSQPGPTTPGDAQSDAECPGMQQKTSNNMYEYPSFCIAEPYDAERWASGMFGASSTRGAGLKKLPNWAVPSSVQPGGAKAKNSRANLGGELKNNSIHRIPQSGDADFDEVQDARRQGFQYLYSLLSKHYGTVPTDLDMDVFLKLLTLSANNKLEATIDNVFLEDALEEIRHRFPIILSSLNRNCNVYADNGTRHDSFSFPFKQDMFTSSRKSSSEEHINTNFSPEGWNGKFGGAPDYFAPPPTSGKKSASPSRRRGTGLRAGMTRTSSPGLSSESVPPVATASADGGEQEPQSATSGPTFSQEEWAKHFKEPSWVLPQQGVPTSPAKGPKASSRKASKSNVKSGVPGARGAQTAAGMEKDQAPAARAEAAPFDEGDAMDIDSEPPPHASEQAYDGASTEVNNAAKEPRPYSVPPPDWRKPPEANPNGNQHPPPAPETDTNLNTNLNTNLDDLSHVEPLARPAHPEGLRNLNDLSSTLPFQSAPANSTFDPSPRLLQLPTQPKVPEPPTKLTKASWIAYTTVFGAYARAFHNFNATMLEHFSARESQAQSQINDGDAWLMTTGERSAGSGWGSYLRECREDERVREAWVLGCERHKEAVEGFEKVREVVRRRAAGGVLGD